jgi:hypothetical protein
MFETVYTMTDWYDGPRRGVASVNGKPHVYESCWTNIGSAVEDVFLLSEIHEETLALAIEDWDIWLRWSAAFKRGETTQETHPCLPDERLRHEELEAQLTSSLVLDKSNAFAATAEFRYNDARFHSAPPMEAEWTRVTFKPSMDQRARYR